MFCITPVTDIHSIFHPVRSLYVQYPLYFQCSVTSPSLNPVLDFREDFCFALFLYPFGCRYKVLKEVNSERKQFFTTIIFLHSSIQKMLKYVVSSDILKEKSPNYGQLYCKGRIKKSCRRIYHCITMDKTRRALRTDVSPHHYPVFINP